MNNKNLNKNSKNNPEATSGKTKRKFSTFFKSLVIELDKVKFRLFSIFQKF